MESTVRGFRHSPAQAEKRNEKGHKHFENGEFGKAADCFHQATKLDPNNSLFWTNYAAALWQLGSSESAELHALHALKLSPDSVRTNYILGLISVSLNKVQNAEASFRKATELDTSHVGAHHELGRLLTRNGRLGEAEMFLRQAVALSPDCAESLRDLAIALFYLGKHGEAEHCLASALEINPEYLAALILKADFEIFDGRFDEAEALLKRALKADPDCLGALAGLVYLRKMTPDDAAWIAAAERCIQKELSVSEEKDLRFAIGKYCDDLGEFERAFSNFQQANELSRLLSGRHYDAAGVKLLVDRTIQFFDGNRVAQVCDGASDSNVPIFIVGMPRSGTSLLEQIIASHPEAAGAGELVFWANAYGSRDATAIGGALGEQELRLLASDYLALLARCGNGAKRVVDKMPQNFFYLGLIHATFPKARIIHIVRNPIDTCLSIYMQNFSPEISYATGLGELACHYTEYHRLMRHWRSVMPPETLLEVPYEGLIAEQLHWTRQVLEFLGLDWSENCLQFHQTQRRVATASRWQVKQPVFDTSQGRWRNYEKFIHPLLGLQDLSLENAAIRPI